MFDVILFFFSRHKAGNVWPGRLSGSDQWGEGHTLHMPLLHSHLQPSDRHCSHTWQQHKLTDIVSNTHSVNTAHPLSPTLADVSCVWFRLFILILSHRGGRDSRRCASVCHKPTQSTWNSKKAGFSVCRGYFPCCNPPFPAGSICLFQGSTSCPGSFSFLWGRAVRGWGFALFVFKKHKISLWFDTFYITKRETVLFSSWLLSLKQ